MKMRKYRNYKCTLGVKNFSFSRGMRVYQSLSLSLSFLFFSLFLSLTILQYSATWFISSTLTSFCVVRLRLLQKKRKNKSDVFAFMTQLIDLELTMTSPPTGIRTSNGTVPSVPFLEIVTKKQHQGRKRTHKLINILLPCNLVRFRSFFCVACLINAGRWASPCLLCSPTLIIRPYRR